MRILKRIKSRKRLSKKRDKTIYLFGILKLSKSSMRSQSLPLIKYKIEKTIYNEDIVYYQGIELSKNKLAKIAKERIKIMRIIEKGDIQFKAKGANDYKSLWAELKSIDIIKNKKDFIIEYNETEIYKIIKSSGRSHLSSKYGLASQLEKDISNLAKRDKKYNHIFCKYTNKDMVFYFSNQEISSR